VSIGWYSHFWGKKAFSMRSMRITKELRPIPFLVSFRPSLAALRLVWPRYSHVKLSAFFLLTFSVIVPGLAIGQSSEQEVELSFRAGQAALRQGDFVHATEEFKKVLSLDPTLLEAEVNLGLAYQGLLQYDLAVRYLDKALRERPNLLGLNVVVGMDYLKLGTPEKASPFLQRALKLDPSNRDAHEAMALYHLSQENFRDAAVEFRQIAVLDSAKAEAWFKLGHEYLDLAARLAYRGARLYRESAWGHRFLGDILFQRDRWEDATQEYRKALDIEPRQSGLHTLLGEAYLRAGKLEESETEFHLELQLDSRNELAWLGLANLQLAKGQPSEALASIGKVWQISPEFLKLRPELPSIELTTETAQASISHLLDQPEGPAKHSLLAGLYASTNENALSEREWKSFQNDFSKWQQGSRPTPQTHADPDPCKAHLYSRCIASLQTAKHLTDSARLLMGKTYFTLQQYDHAAGALAQVHRDTNVNAEASYWLERTYQALGAEAYAQLEDSFPDSWRTHQLRAEGAALRRNLDDAIKEYRAALQLRPDEAELHEALGEFYLDNHSDGDAQGELEKAVASDPSRTKALYLLGRLCVLDRENEKAVPYLQRALRLQPNLNEASGLLGTAYVRMGQFADAIPRLEKAAPLDHYGNVHYQLYLAYRKLGQSELAQKAFARSQDLRRNSLERDQALIMGSPQVESEPQ
jgi:tetratricopeptide (TPR) repeat protein